MNEYLLQNPTWHSEDSPWKADQVIKLIEKHDIVAETVCEIGCGAGKILVQLSGKMPLSRHFTGYDISPQLDDMWKSRAKHNIRFIREDFLISSGTYDLLLLIDVIEHIEDYIGFLRKIKDRGTYKLFNFPLEIFALKSLFSHTFSESRKRYGHIHYFNREICIAVLTELGFQIIDSMYAPSGIEGASFSTSSSFASKLLRIPRILLSKLSIDLTARTLGGYSLFVLAK